MIDLFYQHRVDDQVPIEDVAGRAPVAISAKAMHPVFMTLGEPQAHGDTTKVVP